MGRCGTAPNGKIHKTSKPPSLSLPSTTFSSNPRVLKYVLNDFTSLFFDRGQPTRWKFPIPRCFKRFAVATSKALLSLRTPRMRLARATNSMYALSDVENDRVGKSYSNGSFDP